MTDSAQAFRRYAAKHDQLRSEIVEMPADAEVGMRAHSYVQDTLWLLSRTDAELRAECEDINRAIAALAERIRRLS